MNSGGGRELGDSVSRKDDEKEERKDNSRNTAVKEIFHTGFV